VIAVGAGNAMWGQLAANQHNAVAPKSTDGLRGLLYPPARDL
jgi:hypothetical protein